MLDPATTSSVMLTAATIHSATAKAPIAAPELARMLSHLQLVASENRANHVHSARQATDLRYAAASSLVEEHRFRTFFLSSGGSGAEGSRRENAAGRSAPCS